MATVFGGAEGVALTAGSTGICRTCGHRPNAAQQLYAELANDKATWTDVAFWAVVGAMIGALVQVGIEWSLKTLGVW